MHLKLKALLRIYIFTDIEQVKTEEYKRRRREQWRKGSQKYYWKKKMKLYQQEKIKKDEMIIPNFF